MNAGWLILPVAIIGIALALAIPRLRLKRALARPFPDAWKRVLERNLPVYPKLPEPLRERLHGLIKQFLHEKHFSGAAGLDITDEMRVTIAGEACLLILNRPPAVYPMLRWIVVYPGAFVVDYEDIDEAGVVDPEPREMLGESWGEGKVILAWDSVLRGARNFTDGQNLVLHEFAHQLDSESGYADGAPLLGGEHSYRSWAEVLTEAFELLQESSRSGRQSLLDEYGASHPAEFFAVATETFFERPHQMAQHHQRLFETLQAYYGLDPREWLEE